MQVITSFDDAQALVGSELGVSDWLTIDQQRINDFADVTGDHQWIHVDVERAKKESPFKAPIAHGFLTLSLVPALSKDNFRLGNVKLAINYGLNKVRFPAPVPVGSRLRAHMKLIKCEPIDQDGFQMTWEVTVEREGGTKPVCVAESMARYYP